MNEVLRPVTNYLAELRVGWEEGYGYLDNFLACQFSHRNGKWRSVFETVEDPPESLMVVSVVPFIVPSERRLAAAEFLMYLNWALVEGNFEINPVDGQMRFRFAIHVAGKPPGRSQVEALVDSACLGFPHFLPAIAAVVFEQASPHEALSMLASAAKDMSFPPSDPPMGLD